MWYQRGENWPWPCCQKRTSMKEGESIGGPFLPRGRGVSLRLPPHAFRSSSKTACSLFCTSKSQPKSFTRRVLHRSTDYCCLLALSHLVEISRNSYRWSFLGIFEGGGRKKCAAKRGRGGEGEPVIPICFFAAQHKGF